MPWCSNLQVLSSICSGNIILSYFCFFFIADLLNLKTGNHEKLSETTNKGRIHYIVLVAVLAVEKRLE